MKRRIWPLLAALAVCLALLTPAFGAKPPILVAAFEGDPTSLKPELDAGVHVDTHNSKGLTALMLASGRGHVAVIDALIDAGADIDAKSTYGWTALWLAAEKGQGRAAERLIAAGADIESLDNLNRPPLWMAAARNHVTMVQALLKAGASTETRSSDGGTALMVAASEGHAEVVRILVRAGAQVDARGTYSGISALVYGAERGSTKIVRILIEAGAEMNAQTHGHWVNLRTTARKPVPWRRSHLEGPGCYVDGLKLMVEMHAVALGEPFYRAGWNALIAAAANGHSDVVRYLLARGAAMNARSKGGATALGYAWFHKRQETVQVLTKAGADLLIPVRTRKW